LKVALTLPLCPLSVKTDVVENCPLIGSGLQVEHRTSVPVKFPLPSTVPVKAPAESAQCPFEQVKVPVPEEGPAGVVEVPVQLYVPSKLAVVLPVVDPIPPTPPLEQAFMQTAKRTRVNKMISFR
jgi:hypothetical protein